MISYHISQEQFAPSHLLRLAVLAEQAGFQGIHSSDHFQPWSERQGQSGFTFAWMGAALQATGIPCGMICAPGPRHHPAVIAQAAATLAEMFPDRFWLELGSGEAVNECITGEDWPEKEQRNRRLSESAQIIRELLAGRTVTHQGAVQVKDARLYTRPERSPLLIAAALTPETAARVGEWADGLVTVNRPPDELQEVIRAFRQGGGEGKPLYLKVQLSYAESDQAARDGAYDQWRTNVLSPEQAADLSSVAAFDAAAEAVRPEDLEPHVLISHDTAAHVRWLREYLALGIDHLILHNVNREQERFIRDFGSRVLPALRQHPV